MIREEEWIPASDGPAVAVVVVSYNTRELLRACLASVRPERPAQLVVVDNGSRDGSRDLVESEFPEARLILCDDNPGFGEGANRGIAATESPNVLLLNADTRLAPGALRALAGYLETHPRAGVVGPRLRHETGAVQPSCQHHPTPLHIALRTTVFGRVLPRVPLLRRRYLPASQHDKARTVPWVVGAALALRRRAFDEIGGFDPGYVIYFEEVDLCHRMALAGWEVHFAPVTDVVHVEGASTRQVWADVQVRLFVNAMRFHDRHSPPATRRRLRRVLRLVLLHRLARDWILLRLARSDQRRRRLGPEVRAWRRALRALGEEHG